MSRGTSSYREEVNFPVVTGEKRQHETAIEEKESLGHPHDMMRFSWFRVGPSQKPGRVGEELRNRPEKGLRTRFLTPKRRF
jgi:hypothetical protein